CGIHSVHSGARRVEHRGAPAADAEEAPGGDAAPRVHGRDAARQHVADRHVREQGHARRREKARSRQGERPRGAVLDSDRAVDLQRHARRRAAARRPLLTRRAARPLATGEGPLATFRSPWRGAHATITAMITTTANLTQAVPFFMVTVMDRSLRFYVDGLGFQM